MNHIHRLQQDKQNLTNQVQAANDGLHDLKVYLQSDKFATDTTVQASDVLNRIREIEQAILAAE